MAQTGESDKPVLKDWRSDTVAEQAKSKAVIQHHSLLPLPIIEEVVTRELIESVIRDYDKELTVLDFSAQLGSQHGDNYMSIIYAVNVHVRRRQGRDGGGGGGGNWESNIRIMLKTMPRNSYRQRMLNELRAFEKEGQMYRRVFKDFEEFQRGKGLREEELFRPCPTCYTFYSDGKADYLAMEDLRPAGFLMGNRVHGLDLAHCETVIQNLAKFHAISYAMFGGDFDRILEAYPFLEERMYRKPEEVDAMFEAYNRQMFSTEAEMLSRSGHSAEAAAVLGVYDADFYHRLRAFCAQPVKHAVINHGDCWTNNLMFRYGPGQKSKKIVDFRFIDFQVSRVCSRAIDLLYFLYSSPQIETLNNYEDRLLELYHTEFTAFLVRLGVTLNKDELTLANFLKEVDECRPYGITMGLMLAPVFSAQKENIPDMETLELTDKSNGAQNNDLAQDFIASTMRSNNVANQKILNIARKHLPRCNGVWST